MSKKKGEERKKTFILIKQYKILCVTPILENPTWFPFLGGTVHFIMPVFQAIRKFLSIPLLESGR